ncbi:MAG: hypothetical protein HYZ49_02085 [Chloroflexi bacterium]|nr:hypothetical protein [Chloroflexota bacterium]
MNFTTLAGAGRLLVAPSSGEIAILRTVLYADVFNYPLTAPEIHRYLIGESLALEEAQFILGSSPWLAQIISHVGDFYVVAGREDLIVLRQAHALSAEKLWQVARQYGRLLAALPFVRMVAVTGALAMDNAKPDDDVDYLIVTVPGRVWLVRALAILIVRLARLGGVNLCPNYLLSETSLLQEQRDLFIAHELAQMIPLTGHDLYWQMRSINGWAAGFLPNADSMPRPERDAAPRGPARLGQRWLESLLAGRVGNLLENWERRRKLQKFRPQLRRPATEAVLDETRIKGHFNDYGRLTRQAYEQRCAAYKIDGWAQ